MPSNFLIWSSLCFFSRKVYFEVIIMSIIETSYSTYRTVRLTPKIVVEEFKCKYKFKEYKCKRVQIHWPSPLISIGYS